MERLTQPVATVQRFSLVFAASAAAPFATACHSLQPRGSIKAPAPVVCRGYAAASVGGAAYPCTTGRILIEPPIRVDALDVHPSEIARSRGDSVSERPRRPGA